MSDTHSLVHWQENGQSRSAFWHGDSRQSPPTHILPLAQTSTEHARQQLYSGHALLWRGDYHQGKQLLDALKKRVRSQAKPMPDIHRHRLQQLQHSRLFAGLLLEVGPGWRLGNRRAPDVAAALADVYGKTNLQPFLLPFNHLLGMIGAHEWHRRGVAIDALGGDRIHVPYGVFSPLRGEYLELVATAPLPPQVETAWDIGTGSGVLAAILARRGIRQLIATDTNPRAVVTARDNLARLSLTVQTTVCETDLLPAGQADLIVCNPPWLPLKAGSDIEAALYDPGHSMLHALLQQAPARLRPGGELWVVMSDLAEHLGLRPADALPQWFTAAGLRVIGRLDTRPRHAKATDQCDPLHHARSREITSLWRLAPG